MAAMGTPEVSGPYQLFPAMTEAEYARLREDIRARGVLVPVEVDEAGAILDGHHRVAVCTELGITTYPRLVRAGLSHEEKLAHVIALNLHRRHLARAERRRWVTQLRAMGWSGRRIAAEAGISEATVRRDLKGSGASDDAPEHAAARVTGRDGKTYRATRPTAVLALSAAQQRRATTALAAIPEADRPGRTLDLRRLEYLARTARRRTAAAAAAGGAVHGDIALHHVDFRDLDLPAGSVDLILTDPPYTGPDVEAGIYSDLSAFAARVLAPGGLCVAYAPISFLPAAMAGLGTALDYHWMLIALHGSGAVHQVRSRHLGNAYKPVLGFRARGGEAEPPWFVNVLQRGRRDKTLHDWQQDLSEAAELIDVLTVPGATVCDPFTGSGTTALAAAMAGRRFIGAEIDAQTFAIATARLAAAPQAQPAEA